ncbi:MAG: type IV pilus assembly protein PilM [Candidatus Kerfeldbacteria bacterium]|nr:type IV pilus assembly protein PilM [Candidatus Kerfeldbacteria bacterium]
MTAFGLDISDAWIRLAVLEKSRQRLRLPTRAEIPVAPGLIVDGEIQNPQRVSTLIRELTKAAGIRRRQAFVSLPERHTFIKFITIAADQANDLETAVKDEALHHLPYTWDEVYFDWSTQPKRNAHGQLEVIIGAAPRSLVDTYVTVLEACDVEPIGLDIESLAVTRATYRPGQPPGTTILLDLGRTRSTLMLLHDGLVLFSATVRYAGKELNRYIADEMKISEAQAERAKKIFGLDPHRGRGLLRKVLAPQLDVVVAKIHEVEAFAAEHFPDSQPVKEIALTGSGALLRFIDRELASRLQRPVILQPSWVYEELKSFDPSYRPEIGFIYTTAFGLALMNFPARL